MEDRIPTPGQKGRVLITPEDGSAPYYAKITMADNPTNPGTPLNKSTLLSDRTETAIFGDAANRTVDQAFMGILGKINLIMEDVAEITVTVTDQDGHPVTSALVTGVLSAEGDPVYTNASGVASGYISEGQQTISVTGYADLADVSKSVTVVKGDSMTETLTPTRRNFLRVTSTKNIRFSGDVTTVDSNPVGGGGGAGNSYANDDNTFGHATGGAGGGGYSQIGYSIDVEANTLYPAVVGAGGAAGGGTGGTSSFLGISATGGSGGGNASSYTAGVGGTGNGNGANGIVRSRNSSSGDGLDGAAGTQNGFLSYTQSGLMGGGGGSGGVMGSGGSGGGYGGAGGGRFAGEDGSPGQDGYGGGGGSGLVYISNYEPDGNWYSTRSPARGGSGAVNMRMHFSFGELAA